MATPQKSPRKDPFALRAIRFTFTIVDKVLPPIARRWGFKLFITPYRYELPERERKIAAEAQKHFFSYDGLQLKAYSWGEGPTVLFMHGWAGRGLQISEMVKPLVKSGFKVVTFDAQAHGASEGKTTNLIQMVGALQDLIQQTGPIHTIIGHSFGGTISLQAMKEGLEVQKLITISTPSVGQGIIDEFLRRINGSAHVGQYLRQRIWEITGKSFDDFTAETTGKLVPKSLPVLVIHDRDDLEAPIYHAERLVESMPHAQQFFTTNLGHTRIMRNQEVIDRVVEFTKETDVVTA